ncbi:MAG: type II toxin-antitoxin system RelE/ParE family toxin [Magnetococcus sp. MYC-9]
MTFSVVWKNQAKLEGHPDIWRIRLGDYRVIYTIEDNQLVVLIVRVGHRREVYC